MINPMLEKAIEIEGLIRILRDGTPSAETYSMLKGKVSELAVMAARMEQPKPEPMACQRPETADNEEIHFDADRMPGAGAVDESDAVDLPSYPGDTELEEESEMEYAADDIFISSDDEPDCRPQQSPSGERPASEPKGRNLAAAFSLNDRYLYSRELFEGSMKMFDSTLRFLEGVENFSDIEDYFYNELQWDPDNPHVATFLDILRPHFKE